MGWTKHSDAVKAVQGARSKSRAKANRLLKKSTKVLKNGDDEERVVLARELHSELRRFVRLDEAVNRGGDWTDINPHVERLLELVPAWDLRGDQPCL